MPTWLAVPVVAALYTVVAHESLRLALYNANASPVWPPTGLAIAALLLLGLRAWPGVLVGAFVANLWNGAAVPVAAAMGIGNTLEATVAAWTVAWLSPRLQTDAWEQTTRGLFLFAAICGAAATISASLGVGALVAAGALPMDNALLVWLTWWLGDLAGGLLVTPLLLLWFRDMQPLRRPAEALAILAVLVGIVGCAFFLLPDPHFAVAAITLALPMFLLASFRSGPREVSLAAALFVGLAVLATASQRGPIYTGDSNADLMVLGFLSSLLALTFLSLAALAEERRQSGLVLEQRVVERTQRLAETQERFRGFMTNLPGMAWIKDASGRYEFANEAFAQMLGRAPADLVGRTDFELFPVEIAREYRANDEEARQTNRVVRATERQRVGDETRYSLVHKFPIPNHQADSSIGGVAIDITDRIRAEEDAVRHAEQTKEIQMLREVADLKTRFVNMAAHELNTPLTPIKLQLHTLRRGTTTDLPHSLALLQRNFERMENLVHNLLDVATLESGKLRLNIERMDMTAAATHAVEAFSDLAHHVGVTLAVEAPSDLWMEADHRRVDQVMFNLLANALKFTPQGGRVQLDVQPAGTNARVRVKDAGIGMGPEQLARLFQPFTQVHSDAQTSGVPGSGLGLYVSRHLVELHGGRLWAESQGPGTGTTFLVELPLQQARGATGAAADASRA